MLRDPTIQETALTCMREHGSSASDYAANRADECLNAGHFDLERFWRSVLAEIERIQSMKPKGPVH